MPLSNSWLPRVDRCAHLHDIGKAYISDIINQQTRKLTDEEFFLIRQHPTFGAELLAGTKLAEKYNSVIEGHHKSFDGKSGYPEYFSSVGDRMKVMVDIITIADCIDAATDTLGRNYTKSKTWLPALADELESDEKMRYNQEIVNIIKNDKETCDSISYIIPTSFCSFKIGRIIISPKLKSIFFISCNSLSELLL